MSLGNTSEAAVLALIFLNTDWTNVGDSGGLRGSVTPGSFYISVATADPGETGSQTTSEASYTGYARAAVARSGSGWTASGTAPSQVANAASISMGACTAGSNTLTHFVIGRDSSSTGLVLWYGALTSSLAVSAGITPSFGIGALVATLD